MAGRSHALGMTVVMARASLVGLLLSVLVVLLRAVLLLLALVVQAEHVNQ